MVMLSSCFHLTLAGHTHGGQIGLFGRSAFEVLAPEIHRAPGGCAHGFAGHRHDALPRRSVLGSGSPGLHDARCGPDDLEADADRAVRDAIEDEVPDHVARIDR
jgi:hypothetical protein